MKQVLVTGASRGLGYELTKRYLELGHKVYAGVRDIYSSQLLELKEKYGSHLIILSLEVSDQNSINKAYDTVDGHSSCLDIIINNAAIHSESSFLPLEETNLEDCLSVYNVNSIGPLRVVKTFVKKLRNSNQGKVINISSESGSISTCPREKEFDYCMSKAALNMATKLLDNYLSKDNIKVSSIHPGWMRTDMGGKNAHLDPYETAVKIVDLINSIDNMDEYQFIDNDGTVHPW